MTEAFLTDAELEDMTGLVQPAAQVRWLRKNNVHHYVRADGQVRVPRGSIERPGPADRSGRPNFGALREAR